MSQQLFPFIKLLENPGDVSICFNSIALRKAEIVYNFGLFECNRAKVIIVSLC